MANSKLGEITLTKQTGTVLTLFTEGKYVDNNVYFDIDVQNGTGTVTVSSTDASIVSDDVNRNIYNTFGQKSSTAPSSGYYLKVDATGIGSSSVTTAGWLETGTIGTSSATGSFYFPVTEATITQNAPTIDSSTGIVTATVSTTAGYTPAQASASSNTLQLSTQDAQTIIPTTTDQTISSGMYLTGAQTIKGDANLLASNIKEGVTIFGVTGTYDAGIEVTTEEDVHGGTIVTITTATNLQHYYTGTDEPSSSLGADGDIYLMN